MSTLKLLVLGESVGLIKCSDQVSHGNNAIMNVTVHLYWVESKSDIVLRWGHRESNLMATFTKVKEFAFEFAVAECKVNLNVVQTMISMSTSLNSSPKS